jgi:uncharacterized protein DUF222
MTLAQMARGTEWEETVPARTALVEQLQEMLPGPELATLLASIDRSSLDSEGLLRVAQARQRLIAHQESQFLMDLHAVARAVPDHGPQPGRRDLAGKYPWAEVEAACALRWTYARAGVQMMLADEVIDRLPAIHAALAAGQIDMPKVHALTDAVRPLDDDLARGVVDKVIDKASERTTGELRARLRRLVLAADPETATTRAKRGSVERRVQAFVNENHLANLAGYDLAPHRVAAIMERLDAVARAAKAAGDPRRVDQIRADAFLDLLAGEGIAVGGPITNGSIDPSGGVESPGQLQPGRRRREPVGPEDATAAGAPWPTAPAARALLTDPGEDPVGLPTDPESVADLWAFGVPEPSEDPEQPRLAAANQLVDVEQQGREQLWLAGFDQLPTTHPSRPLASPEAGSQATSSMAASPAVGTATTTGAAALPGPRRGVVELQVPLTTLLGLSQLPGELGGWAPVIADIARQVAAQMRDGTWRWSAYDRFGELAYHGTTNERPATGRFPNAEQTAYVRARDRMCVAPGCRRAARLCDIDHTLPWVKGGPTETCNLGLLCRLHHLFKHSLGCELLQLSSGIFSWKFPSGLQYLTTPHTPLIDDNQLAGLTNLITAGDNVDPGG